MVEHGNHPDLHRLEPEGPGGQIGIGGKDGRRGVRELVTRARAAARRGRLARVAIIRERAPHERRRAVGAAQDARGAARRHDAHPRRRRRGAAAAHGPLALRTDPARPGRRAGTSSALLAERGLADAPTAARLARLAGGRPGLAVAYAAAPEAEAIRGELIRTLLDLLPAGRADAAARRART